MKEGADSTRLLLRAEIRSSKETIVACARDVTQHEVFVVTDWLPPVDTDVDVVLSLPTLLEPIELHARVVEHRPSTGVGEAAGVTLALTVGSEEARDRLAHFVEGLGALRVPPRERTRTYRVLLVEDNAFIRDMFAYGIDKFVKQRKGALRLEHVEDAASAWERLAKEDFDLVIVDYYLPAEDGAGLIARMRKNRKLANVPVVAISVGGEGAREATISAGADLFLDKPVVLRDLFDTLQLLSANGALA